MILFLPLLLESLDNLDTLLIFSFSEKLSSSSSLSLLVPNDT